MFGIGGSKSKSKSKSTSNTQQQTQQQVDIPDYLKPAVTAFAGGVTNAFDLYGTPEKAQQLVAPVSANQTAAYKLASGLPALNDQYSQNYDLLNGFATGGPAAVSDAASQGYTAERYGASSLLENLQDYWNPHTEAVVGTTLDKLGRQQGMDSASLAAKAARSGAFGGSRFGLQQNDLTNLQNMTTADTAANLYSQGFDKATGLSNLDTARRQQAAADNAAAGNRAGEFTAGAANTASLQNAAAQNAAALQNQQVQLAAAQAALDNTNSRGTYNQNAIGTMINAGQDERSVQEAQSNAYLSMLAKVSSIMGVNGGDLLGQSGTTNTQQQGTGSTKGTSISASASYG